MKSHQKHQFKIWEKLSLYFAATLLIFSFIIGIVFLFLFRSYTINFHMQDMQEQALQIADNASLYLSSHHQSGQGAFFRFLGSLSGSDVWLVDQDLNLITPPSAHGRRNMEQYQYSSLPEHADDLVRDVFEGKIAYSNDFSSLLSEVSLTVGVPIQSQTGRDVIGVVLLHSPIRGTEQALIHGFAALGISILIALMISFLLSILFSKSFARPLNQMKQTALKLAGGDYSAKTDIRQSDEIGDLAHVLDYLADELLAASSQSEHLESLRNAFIANISHELRTPVTVIRGSLEALLEQIVTAPDQVSEYYHQMLSESIYLQRLIGDLLELSKLQNTDFEIQKEPLLLHDILSDAVRSAGQLATGRGIRINLQADRENPVLSGDYGRLRQMFLIVLNNAVKFSGDDTEIEVISQAGTVTIRDHGCGIPAKELPYLFERFYKSRSEQNKTGTGLGLAIAKQIANRHEIALYVSSQTDIGTEFTFRLPI